VNATPARPAWARRLPFFYGWLIVAGQFLTTAATAGPTVWAFGLFAVPMGNDLGWSRSTIYGVLSLRLVIGILLLPLTSRLMDHPKWPRIVMVASSAVFAATTIALVRVSSVVEYYVVFGVIGGLSSAGASGLLYQALVPKWFIRKRGIAVSIGTLGSSVAAFISPLLVRPAVDAYGWRTTWLLTGIVMMVLMVPISALTRRSPEDLGLTPDGAPPEQSTAAAGARAQRMRQEHSFTVREVVRKPTTWLLVGATILAAPSLQGLATSWYPHYIDNGISAEGATLAVSMYGAFAIAGRLIWGNMGDRYHIRTIMVVLSAGTGLTLLFLLFAVSSPVTAMIYSAMSGVTLGGYVATNPLIWSNYFGRRYLGAIRGAFAPYALLVAAASPFLIAFIHDTTGTYTLAFWLIFAFWMIAALLVWLARPLAAPKAEPAKGSVAGTG